jgi:hypothetical protein
MGVDGGGGNVGVPQQHCTARKSAPVVEQVRGKGMAQRVRRRDRRLYAGPAARVGLTSFQNITRVMPAPARGDEQVGRLLLPAGWRAGASAR